MSAMVRFSNSTANRIQGSTTIIPETSQEHAQVENETKIISWFKSILRLFSVSVPTILGAAWHEKSS